MWDDSLTEFLKRTKKDGFDATEVFMPALTESPEEIKALHKEHGLQLVAQIITEGNTADEHIACLEERFKLCAACDPLLINSQTARDIFSFEDNVRIFKRSMELSEEHGIMFCSETHRGRPTYSAVETAKFLKALPDLKITADFSHWMVVHESDLSDQPGNVAAAINHSFHVHARVGFAEGPQVTHPAAPEWERELATHLDLWQRIVDRRAGENAPFLTICPEFGPIPYMPTLPFTNVPVADAWEINVTMKNMLKDKLKISAPERT